MTPEEFLTPVDVNPGGLLVVTRKSGIRSTTDNTHSDDVDLEAMPDGTQGLRVTWPWRRVDSDGDAVVYYYRRGTIIKTWVDPERLVPLKNDTPTPTVASDEAARYAVQDLIATAELFTTLYRDTVTLADIEHILNALRAIKEES